MSDDSVNPKLPSYEVHHAGAERAMREIGRALKATMPPGFGYALFIFEYDASKDAPGSTFYLSSGGRVDVFKMVKEFIAQQEKQG